jgi:HK97 family phage prohead protease
METEKRALLPGSAPEIVADSDDGPKKIVGYAVRWGQLSNPIGGYFVEKFERGAFTKSLAAGANDAYAAWNHNDSEVLGRYPNTLKLEEDEIGLRYEITPPNWASGRVETIDRGDVKGSSFIFRAVNQNWDEANEDMPIRSVIEAEIYEVSPVTTPAYPTSSASVRSAENVFNEYKEQRQKPFDGVKLRQRERDLHLKSRGK